MNENTGLFGRPGRFSLSRDCDVETILAIQRDVLIAKAGRDFMTDRWEFGGYSKHFRLSSPGEIIPIYQCVVTSPIPGVYSVAWEELPNRTPEPMTPPEPPAPWWRRLWAWWSEKVR